MVPPAECCSPVSCIKEKHTSTDIDCNQSFVSEDCEHRKCSPGLPKGKESCSKQCYTNISAHTNTQMNITFVLMRRIVEALMIRSSSIQVTHWSLCFCHSQHHLYANRFTCQLFNMSLRIYWFFYFLLNSNKFKICELVVCSEHGFLYTVYETVINTQTQSVSSSIKQSLIRRQLSNRCQKNFKTEKRK